MMRREKLLPHLDELNGVVHASELAVELEQKRLKQGGGGGGGGGNEEGGGGGKRRREDRDNDNGGVDLELDGMGTFKNDPLIRKILSVGADEQGQNGDDDDVVDFNDESFSYMKKLVGGASDKDDRKKLVRLELLGLKLGERLHQLRNGKRINGKKKNINSKVEKLLSQYNNLGLEFEGDPILEEIENEMYWLIGRSDGLLGEDSDVFENLEKMEDYSQIRIYRAKFEEKNKKEKNSDDWIDISKQGERKQNKEYYKLQYQRLARVNLEVQPENIPIIREILKEHSRYYYPSPVNSLSSLGIRTAVLMVRRMSLYHSLSRTLNKVRDAAIYTVYMKAYEKRNDVVIKEIEETMLKDKKMAERIRDEFVSGVTKTQEFTEYIRVGDDSIPLFDVIRETVAEELDGGIILPDSPFNICARYDPSSKTYSPIHLYNSLFTLHENEEEDDEVQEMLRNKITLKKKPLIIEGRLPQSLPSNLNYNSFYSSVQNMVSVLPFMCVYSPATVLEVVLEPSFLLLLLHRHLPIASAVSFTFFKFIELVPSCRATVVMRLVEHVMMMPEVLTKISNDRDPKNEKRQLRLQKRRRIFNKSYLRMKKKDKNKLEGNALLEDDDDEEFGSFDSDDDDDEDDFDSDGDDDDDDDDDDNDMKDSKGKKIKIDYQDRELKKKYLQYLRKLSSNPYGKTFSSRHRTFAGDYHFHTAEIPLITYTGLLLQILHNWDKIVRSEIPACMAQLTVCLSAHSLDELFAIFPCSSLSVGNKNEGLIILSILQRVDGLALFLLGHFSVSLRMVTVRLIKQNHLLMETIVASLTVARNARIEQLRCLFFFFFFFFIYFFFFCFTFFFFIYLFIFYFFLFYFFFF
jgi:hypothetical protein